MKKRPSNCTNIIAHMTKDGFNYGYAGSSNFVVKKYPRRATADEGRITVPYQAIQDLSSPPPKEGSTKWNRGQLSAGQPRVFGGNKTEWSNPGKNSNVAKYLQYTNFSTLEALYNFAAHPNVLPTSPAWGESLLWNDDAHTTNGWNLWLQTQYDNVAAPRSTWQNTTQNSVADVTKMINLQNGNANTNVGSKYPEFLNDILDSKGTYKHGFPTKVQVPIFGTANSVYNMYRTNKLNKNNPPAPVSGSNNPYPLEKYCGWSCQTPAGILEHMLLPNNIHAPNYYSYPAPAYFYADSLSPDLEYYKSKTKFYLDSPSDLKSTKDMPPFMGCFGRGYNKTTGRNDPLGAFMKQLRGANGSESCIEVANGADVVMGGASKPNDPAYKKNQFILPRQHARQTHPLNPKPISIAYAPQTNFGSLVEEVYYVIWNGQITSKSLTQDGIQYNKGALSNARWNQSILSKNWSYKQWNMNVQGMNNNLGHVYY